MERGTHASNQIIIKITKVPTGIYDNAFENFTTT